jgi:hypothetical protein
MIRRSRKDRLGKILQCYLVRSWLAALAACSVLQQFALTRLLSPMIAGATV